MPRVKLVYDPEKPWFRQWQTPIEDSDLPDYGLQIRLLGWVIIFY